MQKGKAHNFASSLNIKTFTIMKKLIFTIIPTILLISCAQPSQPTQSELEQKKTMLMEKKKELQDAKELDALQKELSAIDGELNKLNGPSSVLPLPSPSTAPVVTQVAVKTVSQSGAKRPRLEANEEIIYSDALINATSVLMRVGPGTNHEKMASFTKGEPVDIYSQHGNSNEQDPWYKVKRSNGQVGWVYGKFLDIEESDY